MKLRIFHHGGTLLIVVGLLAPALTFPLFGNEWAFTGVTPGSHQGAVTAIVHSGDTVISAGMDGFLGIWNTGGGTARAVDRFQVSLYGITAMAKRPGRDEVCLIESDYLGFYRISAWNYRDRRNIFTLDFHDPKRYINYSPTGELIIVTGTGRTALLTVNSSTGRIVNSLETLTGSAVLAAIGNSQRNIMVYFSSGRLSYWDIGSGEETNSFNVPANLSSPVFFSNNRYLAGLTGNGLAVVNNTTGEVPAEDESVPANSLLYPAADDFFCLIQKGGTDAELRRYTINSGNLIARSQFPLPPPAGAGRYTAMAYNGNAGGQAVLGTSDGNLAFANNGKIQAFAAAEKARIIDTAVSRSTLAFLTDKGTLGFIPRDYHSISAGETLQLEQSTGHNRITAFAGENNGKGRFIFWHDRSNRTSPVIRSPDSGDDMITLSVNFRSSVHSVSSFEGKILFLDSAGNLSVISPLASERTRSFTYSSIGIMGADFADSERLILSRSAVSGNSPFLLLNINTGETVPLTYPSQAGIAVHRGSSGNVYAAVVSGEDTIVTAIIRIDLANSADSVTFTEFQGEAAHLSLAESQGSLAALAGGESLVMSSPGSAQKTDRTPGFPLRFLDSGIHLISLDREGNIAWHDSRTGKLLAVFSLQAGSWTLQTERGAISGGLRNGE